MNFIKYAGTFTGMMEVCLLAENSSSVIVFKMEIAIQMKVFPKFNEVDHW